MEKVMQLHLYFSPLLNDRALGKLLDQKTLSSVIPNFTLYYWIVKICHFFSSVAIYSFQEHSIMISNESKLIFFPFFFTQNLFTMKMTGFFSFLLFIYFILFFFFLRERESESEHKEGRETEGGKQRIPSRLHAQHRVQCGARSHDPGIMTRAKIKSRMLKWLNHPGIPDICFWTSGRKILGNHNRPGC